MRRLALAFLLAATPVHAEPDARQLPIQTARDNGCLLTDAVAKAALLSLGVTEADLLATFQAMRSAGEADATIGAMRLAPPLCEGVTHARLPSVTPQMAREIAVFRANCCRLEADAATPRLPNPGSAKMT